MHQLNELWCEIDRFKPILALKKLTKTPFQAQFAHIEG